MNVKEILLKLSDVEKLEREKVRKDYYYYLGECRDKSAAIGEPALLGQSWITADDLDYVPAQVIDNKIKPLLKKQARFMFGKEPDILLKPYNSEDKEKAEELRQYIDYILQSNRFWSETLKAFLLSTVKKRVMIRMEANPGQPIRVYHHDINDFSYTVNPNNINEINSVTMIKQDIETSQLRQSEQIWYRYTYYMEKDTCKLRIETFKGYNLETPIKDNIKDTLLTRIPCWIIINGNSLNSPFGETELTDLKPLQNQYNRKLSDFSDALRFNMFGQTVVIDGTPESVNTSKIAPNALMTLVSLEDRAAKVQRLESSFTNAEPVNIYLKKLENDMYEQLSIPRPEQLENVPSAKSIKYMYNDLIARCYEKWNDWEPAIKELIFLIVEACGKFKCYDDWKNEWNKLDYSIVIKKNFPIPEDIEEAKKLAMEEVQNNVRSHRSYIKDFSDDEDAEAQFRETVEDIKTINEAEQDQFQKSINDELSNLGNGTGGGS